jgi:hypothetical protein
MSQRHASDAFEARLDELLCQVAAEPDAEERIRADVSRWMQTRTREDMETFAPASRTRRPWLRAAAVLLAVGGLGAAGYWDGWITPRSEALQIESPDGRAAALTHSEDAESWYVQVARAPDAMRAVESPDARRCTSDSWYCAQARPESSGRDL